MRYNSWLTKSDILGAFPFLFEVEENIQVEVRLGVDGTVTEEPWEKQGFQKLLCGFSFLQSQNFLEAIAYLTSKA